MNQLAYDLLLNEEYPGWLYCVKLGATTIWERWNSLDASGHFSSTGMNSLNHYAYGSIVEWIYKHAAGITPLLETPGFRNVRFEPKPDARLKYIEAIFDSPIGIYKSAWRIDEDDKITLKFTVPFGGRVELILTSAPDELYISSDNKIFHKTFINGTEKVCILDKGDYNVEYYPTKIFRHKYSTQDTIGELLKNNKVLELIDSELHRIRQLPIAYYEKTLLELHAMSPENLTKEKLERIDQLLQNIK